MLLHCLTKEAFGRSCIALFAQEEVYRPTLLVHCSDRSWLARLVTRCERPEDFMRALNRQPEDIKVVVQFAEV